MVCNCIGGNISSGVCFNLPLCVSKEISLFLIVLKIENKKRTMKTSFFFCKNLPLILDNFTRMGYNGYNGE
jgi:hypothetical protein